MLQYHRFSKLRTGMYNKTGLLKCFFLHRLQHPRERPGHPLKHGLRGARLLRQGGGDPARTEGQPGSQVHLAHQDTVSHWALAQLVFRKSFLKADLEAFQQLPVVKVQHHRRQN